MTSHRFKADLKHRPRKVAPPGTPTDFRLSIRQLLLLVALASVVLAGSRVLPPAWLVWLATAAFYLAIVLLFTSQISRTRR